MSRPVLPKQLVKLHADLPRKSMRRLTRRVEWVFKTLQDRLVKEMRIAGVKSLQEANRFLAGYLGTFNRRFMKEALKPGGLHRPLPKSVVLDDVLCIKGVRTVNEGYLV